MTAPPPRRWILLLAALTATTALSIDMSLPAQPLIARDFGVSSDIAQLTLSVFLIGFAAGQLVVGYLSDALGRRRVLLGGLSLFTLAGLLCAVSPTMGTLLLARLLQGAGAAAGPVLARAMVRDTQPLSSAARILATMMTALAVAPMIAPSIGGVLLQALGWHSIFSAHAAFGLILGGLVWKVLVETLPPERRTRFAPRTILASLRQFFGAPGTRVPTALIGLSFGGQFAFISDSPFVLIEHHGVAATRYGLYFGATAVALMLGAASGSRLLRTHPPSRMVLLGTSLLCAGGLLTALSVRSDRFGPLGLVVPMLVCFLGVGLTGPPSTAIAMEPVPHIAGTASAFIGGLQMLSGALSGWLVTRIGGSDPRVLSAAVALMGTAAAVLALVARPGRSGHAAPAAAASQPAASPAAAVVE
jgi:DHA1 family bicyclomycin/chloramphenicol resistance-like MFS transporter